MIRIPLILLLLLASLTGGCAYARLRNPVPLKDLDAATLPGYPLIRAWGDGYDPRLDEMIKLATDQEAAYRAAHGDTGPLPPAYALAISGGSANGAFGAGFLTGWAQSGTRPEFKVVTGVSTGALIAPFAFLGPRYDPALATYAQVKDSDIYIIQPFLKLLSAEAATDPTPLQRLIERMITPELLKEIAAEHLKGRRLLVATTHLDAQRPMVWDMGAIAASGNPDALQLFRQILLASASLPGIFPPVYLDVQANGQTYDEMHVDGCTTAQVFFLSAAFSPRAPAATRPDSGPSAGQTRPIHLFVIRNARSSPEYHPSQAGLIPITLRAIDTLIKANGNGDVIRIYALARRDNFHFHLIDIPSSVNTLDAPTLFDPAYMQGLYAVGLKTAQTENPWQERPFNFVLDPPTTQPATLPSTANP